MHSPILRLVDDVTYFHVEGPVLTLQRAISGSLWRQERGKLKKKAGVKRIFQLKHNASVAQRRPAS